MAKKNPATTAPAIPQSVINAPRPVDENPITPEKKELLSKYDLEREVFSLLREEPFFAALSRQIDKQPVKDCPTAGVMINKDGYFDMIYNPEWFAELAKKDQVGGLLMHEFMHITLDHLTTRFVSTDKDNPRKVDPIFNIAGDLAINCNIPRNKLPDNGCIPGEGKFKDYPPNKTLEWYYSSINNDKKLKEELEKMMGAGDQLTLDDHGGWGQGDENEQSRQAKEIARARLRDMLEKAANECDKSNSWGSVSSSMQGEIRKFIAGSVDWRSILRSFVRTSKRAEKHNSIRKINKRFPMIHPGKKVTRHANIAISIDQSGSVDDNLLTLFFSELDKLANIATFTVIPFDTEVFEDKVYEWKKGQKRKAERVLCGGTCFTAPTEYVNKGKWDGHIILTDLCAPEPVKSKVQRMWMTSKAHADAPYFRPSEKLIAITDTSGD